MLVTLFTMSWLLSTVMNASGGIHRRTIRTQPAKKGARETTLLASAANRSNQPGTRRA
jgi:hypothetical protein